MVNHDLEHVRVFNAGMPDVLIVDGVTNKIKYQLESNGLPLGVVATIDAKEMVRYVPISHNDKILMYSDGLTEARNHKDREFGSKRLFQSITGAARNQVFEQIFADLDDFCGENTAQVDDVTLVEITCVPEVLPEIEIHDYIRPSVHHLGDRGEWKMSLRFNGERLLETNPVPILVNFVLEMEQLEKQKQALFTVITELYSNALDHGVLDLDSSLKSDPAGFESYFRARESRLVALDSGHVIFHLSVEQAANRRSIMLRVEDSGKGFDYEALKQNPVVEPYLSGRGITLVKDLCESLEYHGKGNIAVAVFSWTTSKTGNNSQESPA